MMAGKMRLRTFLLIGAVAFAGLFVLAGAGAASLFGGDEEEPVAAPSAPVAAPAPAPVAAPVAAPAPDAARPWDSFLLSKAGSSIGGDKVKDATGGTAYKVNLYQDAGNATMNRAKVDIDRDDKWDEKWTFAPDGVTRQVAPADDESYTETWVWDGGAWQRR